MQKTAVITGGNSGIGLETARELVRRGFRVIITGRDGAKLEAAARAIGGAEVRVGDFASLAQVRALYEKGATLEQVRQGIHMERYQDFRQYPKFEATFADNATTIYQQLKQQ